MEEMRSAPRLEVGENIRFTVIAGKTVLCGTDRRLIIRPKIDTPLLEPKKDIYYNNIKYLKRKGVITKDVDIETDTEIIRYKLNSAVSDELVKNLISVANLEKLELKSREAKEVTVGKKVLSFSTSAIGTLFLLMVVLIGGILILAGFLLCLTLIGAIIGLPLMIIGYWVLDEGGALASFGIRRGIRGFSKLELWKRRMP